MIDWKLAPKGAETLRQVKKFGYLRWFNSEDQAWYGKEWDFPVDEYETIATRPTQTKTVADSSQQSCSEGEKWTHTDADEDECFIVHAAGDWAWVSYKRCIRDAVVPLDCLKPIKPRITKAEAWDKVQEMSLENVTCYYACTSINEKYEVIDD